MTVAVTSARGGRAYHASMRRNLAFVVVLAAAPFVAGGCGADRPPEPGALSAAAHDAWKLYRARPAADTFHDFLKKNAVAGNTHVPHDDAVALEYRCRALEGIAAEAERTSDAALADQVVEQVEEIERHELLDVYDEALRGAKKRFLDAKARAAKVVKD